MAEKGNLITGARTRFSIGGKKVGYARGVTLTEEIEYQPIEVLDNIETEEHVPIAYRVSFSASLFRIVGNTFKSLGYFPKVGQNVNEHLSNILTSGVLTGTIEDTQTGRILQTIEQVKVGVQNLQFDARGVTGLDVTFNAIRLKDESEVV